MRPKPKNASIDDARKTEDRRVIKPTGRRIYPVTPKRGRLSFVSFSAIIRLTAETKIFIVKTKSNSCRVSFGLKNMPSTPYHVTLINILGGYLYKYDRGTLFTTRRYDIKLLTLLLSMSWKWILLKKNSA